MISILGTVQYIDNVACVISTYFGLSTDTPKPTDGVGNGSAFVEMDTSKIFFYDSDSQDWLEWGAEASSVQSASPASLNLSPLTRPGLTTQVIEPEIEPNVVEDGEPEEEEQEEVQEEEPDQDEVSKDV